MDDNRQAMANLFMDLDTIESLVIFSSRGGEEMEKVHDAILSEIIESAGHLDLDLSDSPDQLETLRAWAFS